MSGKPEPAQSSGFAELYQRCASMVARRARQILGADDAAQDATQEVFMRVLDAFPDLLAARPSVSWLYQVTTNHCLNVIRDSRRRQGLLHVRGQVGPVTSEIETPLALLLGGLPDHLHEVAIYYYVDEMSQQEIAQLLGVSQRTVSTRLEEFRATLQREWNPPCAKVS